MFQPGDRVRYTGRFRNACGWLKPNQREGVFEMGDSKRPGDVAYTNFDNIDERRTAHYIGDIELAHEEVVEEDWS